MFMKKFVLRAAGASLAAIITLATQPLSAQTSSESERLKKLERAVDLLEKRNAELQAEINSLKTKEAAYPPEGKMKTKVTYDGKTYVEKAVVEEEKPPVYVQQRGPELKLVLGGFVQMNFEDGDVSAFEGRFGQTALKDRFRLRRARINLTTSRSKATLSRATDLTRAAQRSRAPIFSSTGISFPGRRSKSANGKRHLAWSKPRRTLPCISSSAACLRARSRRSGRSAFSSGENRSRAFGLSRRTC